MGGVAAAAAEFDDHPSVSLSSKLDWQSCEAKIHDLKVYPIIPEIICIKNTFKKLCGGGGCSADKKNTPQFTAGSYA